MSTDEGKHMILNPVNKAPISSYRSILSYPRIINKRVCLFIEAFFRSENVLQQFENLKEEFLFDFKRIAFELLKMERDWIETPTYDTENASLGMFLPHSIARISLFEYLIMILSRGVFMKSAVDRERNDTINRLYDNYKLMIKDFVYKHLKSNHGIFFLKMVDNVTEDLFPKWIKHLEKTIQTLLDEREKIIANQESFNKLAEAVKDFQESAKKIHLLNPQNRIERKAAGLL